MSFFVNLPPSGGGGIASINGDTTADQVIAAGAGISVVSSGGTTTISNTDVATESFTIWQTDHGTYPTASSPTDTMDVTSSDASITVTGNASTKTINLVVAGSFLPLAGGTMTGTIAMGSHNIQGASYLLSDGEVDLFSNTVNNLTLFGGQIYWRGQMNWRDNNTYDIGAAGNAPRDIILGRNVRAAGNLGVGNSAAGSTLGTVVKKIEIFDASGTSLGFIPVYDAIT